MALRKDKTVPFRIPGILGIYAHLLEIEIGVNIRSGKRTAGMAGFRMINAFDDVHPDLAGSDLQALFLTAVHSLAS